MSFAFIRKRSKNYIVYLEYKDENSGKKIQKNMGSFEKKRDASRKLNELKDSIFNDELVLPNAVNLENFLIDFLEICKFSWDFIWWPYTSHSILFNLVLCCFL